MGKLLINKTKIEMRKTVCTETAHQILAKPVASRTSKENFSSILTV